jgi:DNA/RNA-binding domain of Phe-tRNA-synthetase-like protein
MLEVAADLLELGLCAGAVVARGVRGGKTPPELLAYRKQAGARLAAFWKNRSISAHPAIAEYHRLHEQFGARGQVPAPEKLITYIRRKKDLTAAGPVVDCYNLVSARTLLSIGAHDLAKFTPPITLRSCTPKDMYTPLGQTDPVSVAGEYAYVDADYRVICRLEVLQGDFSKVTAETRDVVFFLQGNRLLPSTILLKGAWLLAEMITRFCGGSCELVSFHDATASGEPIGKPTIGIDQFRGLNLQVGTVVSSTRHATMSSLHAVRVHLDKEVEALSIANAEADSQVVVATNLHPLRVGQQEFTAQVLTAHSRLMSPLRVAEAIPDGKRLS